MKELRSNIDSYFIKDFMLKQINDFIRLYEEVNNSHDLAIIEALKYKLDEINIELSKRIKHDANREGGENGE